jgi:3-oxoacid CoA-transferase subunit A
VSSKQVASAAEALAGLQSGMTVAVGGFGLSGNPEALIEAVLETGVDGLTLVANNAGAQGQGLARWLQAGIVRRFVGSYVGRNADLQQAIDDGSIELELVPQGTFAERLRAAGAGIGAFYTPTAAGTALAEGKESRMLQGREMVLEHALPVDFALVRAHRADPFGNLCFRGTSRNFGPAMLMAAKTGVVEAEEVVELGALDPNQVHLPGVFVQRVLAVGQHADPIERRVVRPRSGGAR